MIHADSLASHEIVLAKRSSYHVPAMCPGCGGAVEVVRKLAHSTLAGRVRGAGLTLRIGFCRPCSDAYTLRGQPAWWIALGAAAVALMVSAAMAIAPPAPQLVVVAVPCILTAIAIGGLQRRWSVGTGSSSGLGTPYRTPASAPARAAPSIPIQLVYRDASSALLFCADAGWAADFGLANGLEVRRRSAVPRLPFFGFAAVTGMSVAALGGLGAWHFQWPVLVLDNPTTETVTIFLDGAPRWRIPPLRARDAPLQVRIARGTHRIAHQLDAGSPPSRDVTVVVDGVMTTSRKMYDPLASGCYVRYPVVYGGGRTPAPTRLPAARIIEPAVDHFFRDAPESVRLEKGQSETPWVLERDAPCFELARSAAVDRVARTEGD